MNTKNQAIGILDIGSNSVRFVVFEPPYIGQRPLFNEKVQCGLGRDLGTTGALNPDAVNSALYAINGFTKIAQAMEIETLKIVGTAALRDANNGDAFIARVQNELGVKINVLSGEEEAYYSAQGVLSTFPHATGVVGDLGGGSLGLAKVQNGLVKKTLTLPIGVLRVMAQTGKLDFIEQAIRTIPEEFKGHSDFYVVGGTWRAVARAHMLHKGLIDSRPNGYHIPADLLIDFTRMLSQQSPDRLMIDYDVERKRAELLPGATLVLSSLTRAIGARNIIMSNAGLRDGVLLDILASKKN